MRALYCICLASLVCLAIYTWIEFTYSEVQVTDLSEMTSNTPPKDLPKKSIVFIQEKNTAKMKSTTTLDKNQIEILECELNKKTENVHIAAHKDTVSRSGKTLTVSIPGRRVALENYYKSGTPDEEGDSVEFIYSGTLEKTNYHKVEVEYMHDSPWMYLINSVNGSVLLANVGEHTVRRLNDRILLINNSLNPPFGIVLVHLSDLGHKVELVCRSHRSNKSSRIIDEFEGWDDKLYGKLESWQNGPEPKFQLLVKLPKQGASASKDSLLAPLQFLNSGVSDSNVVRMEVTLVSGKWHIYVPKLGGGDLSSRLSCWSD